MNKRIFLLEPIKEKDKYPNVLIWSDNESDARKNAGLSTIEPAQPSCNETEPEDVLPQVFYRDEKNASCSLLDNSEFDIAPSVKQNNKDEEEYIMFAYKDKNYTLQKNEAEIVDK